MSLGVLWKFYDKGTRIADELRMSTNSIANLSSNYLQSIFNTALQQTGLMSSSTSTSGSSLETQADNNQLSPLAQVLSTLQQLQESNPTQYQQVTQQIATNLQNAAQTATSDGNTTAAAQLNQLATDFSNASQSGQLPNIQDLAQAIGGGHQHHHGSHQLSSSDSSDSSSSSSSTTSASSTGSTDATGSTSALEQLLAAFQSSTSQNESLNPMSIIMNTLSSAGITLTQS
jgi:hypothetical protein